MHSRRHTLNGKAPVTATESANGHSRHVSEPLARGAPPPSHLLPQSMGRSAPVDTSPESSRASLGPLPTFFQKMKFQPTQARSRDEPLHPGYFYRQANHYPSIDSLASSPSPAPREMHDASPAAFSSLSSLSVVSEYEDESNRHQLQAFKSYESIDREW